MSNASVVAVRSNIQRNPFNVLGATTRDGRAHIIELADERSLSDDEAECRKAQNALVNLRARLSAEMGWLPGVAPRKATLIVEGLAEAHPGYGADLPPLSRANVLAALIEHLGADADLAVIKDVVLRLASAMEQIDLTEVRRDLNEDRTVAGFAEVRDDDAVAEEFEARRRHYRQVVGDLLDKFATKTLIGVLDGLAADATANGSRPAPAVIGDLMESYETAAQGFLEQESEVLIALLKRTKEVTQLGEGAVTRVFAQIEASVRNFNSVMRPIQVVRHASGLLHEPSRDVAGALRDLAIEATNEHYWIDLSSRITEFVAEQFPYVDDVLDKVVEDRAFLANAFEQRTVTQERDAEFERFMTYSASIGLVFKDKVEITPSGITWKGQYLPFENVTRLRWGGTSQSMSFVVGDDRTSLTVELSDQRVFGELVDRIWRGAGVRILLRMVQRLKEGGHVSVGDTAIRDDGVVLKKRKLLAKPEYVVKGWNQVRITSGGGQFTIFDKDDSKICVNLPYLSVDNVPVLENLVRAFFNGDKSRPSELFD